MPSVSQSSASLKLKRPAVSPRRAASTNGNSPGKAQPDSRTQKTKRKNPSRAASAKPVHKIKKSTSRSGARTSLTGKEPAHYVEPMKALSISEIVGDQWLLEIKYDGYRSLGIIRSGQAELWSRNEKSLTENYPEIAHALGEIKCHDATVDGEIVALDGEGRPTFQLLQGRDLGQERPPILYYAFDLLHLNGRSLLQEPIEVRRELLEALLKGAPDAIRISPVFDQTPAVLLEEVRRRGLEGIIGKQRGSFYEPGRRSGSWVKRRISVDQEFVIGGYTAPRGGRTHFGALLVGFYEGGNLFYAGKVGTGFNSKLLQTLHVRFKKFTTKECPFANLPTKKPRYGLGMTASAMREVTWLRPELVCQIRFSEWTRDAMLRQPVFLGLREDKRAEEVVREDTASAEG